MPEASNRNVNYAKIAQGLSELESDVGKQAAAIATISSEVGALKSSIDDIKSAISNIAEKQNKGSNWGVLAAWSTVLVSIIAGLGYLALVPVQNDLTENRELLKESSALFLEHVRDGHPQKVMDMVDSLRLEVEENETEALREMQQVVAYEAELTNAKLKAERELSEARIAHLRDLISANSNDVSELDDMLQREMRLLDNILQREMGLHVDRLNEKSNLYETKSAERHQLQREQIDRLQKNMEGK